jgi:anthranilate phosphoribosyltransferase
MTDCTTNFDTLWDTVRVTVSSSVPPDAARLLRNVAYGGHLSVNEARTVLDEIEDNDVVSDTRHTDGVLLAAFTFGLMARGPTVDELAGIVESIARKSPIFPISLDRQRVIDISGTGGDALKTLNVGSAASFIVAAGGGIVAKQATRSYTGPSGSADLFRALGLDVMAPDLPTVERLLAAVDLAAFYTPAYTKEFSSRLSFLHKLTTVGFTYPTPWHLVAWVYSPIDMANRLYGVFDDRYRTPLAELFRRRGYERIMVVYGEPGIDEISVVGDTTVTEIRDGVQREYVLSPEDLGVNRAQPADLCVYTPEEETLLNSVQASPQEVARIKRRAAREMAPRVLRVLYGADDGPQQAFVAVNAGAALYLCGIAPTIRDGVALSLNLINSGEVRRRVEAFADTLNCRERLRRLEKRSRVR